MKIPTRTATLLFLGFASAFGAESTLQLKVVIQPSAAVTTTWVAGSSLSTEPGSAFVIVRRDAAFDATVLVEGNGWQTSPAGVFTAEGVEHVQPIPDNDPDEIIRITVASK